MKITCRCNPTGTLQGWNYKLRSGEELFVTIAEVVPLQNQTISILSLEPEQTKYLEDAANPFIFLSQYFLYMWRPHHYTGSSLMVQSKMWRTVSLQYSNTSPQSM